MAKAEEKPAAFLGTEEPAGVDSNEKKRDESGATKDVKQEEEVEVEEEEEEEGEEKGLNAETMEKLLGFLKALGSLGIFSNEEFKVLWQGMEEERY